MKIAYLVYIKDGDWYVGETDNLLDWDWLMEQGGIMLSNICFKARLRLLFVTEYAAYFLDLISMKKNGIDPNQVRIVKMP